MDVLFILVFFRALLLQQFFPIHFVQVGVQEAYGKNYISASKWLMKH